MVNQCLEFLFLATLHAYGPADHQTTVFVRFSVDNLVSFYPRDVPLVGAYVYCTYTHAR